MLFEFGANLAIDRQSENNVTLMEKKNWMLMKNTPYILSLIRLMYLYIMYTDFIRLV